MSRRDTSDNPYRLLGVTPQDDFATIRAAWRRLVKTYHPDVWYGSEREATERLMAVNDAFDRITVLHKRVREASETFAEKPQPRRKPKPLQARKPRPEPPRQAEPQQTAPSRTNRPSPYAGHFDAARAVFSARPQGKVQSFA